MSFTSHDKVKLLLRRMKLLDTVMVAQLFGTMTKDLHKYQKFEACSYQDTKYNEDISL